MSEMQSQASVDWIRLGNVPISRVSFDQAEALIGGWIGAEPFRLVVTPNVDHIMTLQQDERFMAVYERADLSLADGKPVIWAAQYLGLGALEKVSGSDLVPRLCERGGREGWRAYFVGGRSPKELKRCLAAIERRYNGLIVDGYCPPMGFQLIQEESRRLLDAIRDAQPDILFFACGAPKSEIWMDEHREQLGRGVGLGIGAGLRFLAGLERRAPRWMQQLGLEWSWRMMMEPRRLWKRYLVEDMKFFPLVRQWKRAQKQPSDD